MMETTEHPVELVVVEEVHGWLSFGPGHKFRSRSGKTRHMWFDNRGRNYNTGDEPQSLTMADEEGIKEVVTYRSSG